MNTQNQENDRLIKLTEVMDIVGICRSQVYSLIAKEYFPAPIRLSAGPTNRCSRWSYLEIIQWVEEKKSSRKAA